MCVNINTIYSDGEILYGIKNIKKKLIHSKTGIKSGKKRKVKKINKKKPTKSNDSHSVLSYSSTTPSNQRRKVKLIKILILKYLLNYVLLFDLHPKERLL